MAKQNRDQKRKDNQRKYEKRQQERKDAYIDGVDSISDELQRLILDPPVKGLLGLHQVDYDQFTTMSTNELLAHVGLGGEDPMSWDSPYQTNHQLTAKTNGTGFVCGMLSAHRRVLPVVFLCKEVEIVDDVALSPEYHDGLKATIRLCVLLHELGHAEDILKGINFDHDRKKVDIIGAEAYAHNFVLQVCKKNHYRLAMGQYVSQIDRWIAEEQTEEYVRLAAIRVSEMCNLDEYRSFSKLTWSDVPWQLTVQRERMIDQKLAELNLTPAQEIEYRKRIASNLQ